MFSQVNPYGGNAGARSNRRRSCRAEAGDPSGSAQRSGGGSAAPSPVAGREPGAGALPERSGAGRAPQLGVRERSGRPGGAQRTRARLWSGWGAQRTAPTRRRGGRAPAVPPEEESEERGAAPCPVLRPAAGGRTSAPRGYSLKAVWC